MNDEKFSTNEVGDLTTLVKKARRKTILRNTIISLIVSLLILIVGYIGNLQLLYKSGDDTLRDISRFKQITGPNLYESGYQQNFGLFNGSLEYHTYKIIEGKPVIWSNDTFEFNILGNFSRFPGNYSPIQINNPVIQKEKLSYYIPYNSQTGQREMLFYHPEIDYGKYINDLSLLEEIDNRSLVEMGISFDQSYSLEEVKKMLPSNVHPVWFWVDTCSEKELHKTESLYDGDKIPESADMVYGFGSGIDNKKVSEQDFLSSIETGLSVKGKYYSEYKRIFDNLRKDKKNPLKSDVKIIGVVVTGTAENLKALKDQKYIKATTLGVVTDKY
ncbi:anti sigma factor C-terminal domain-containing protein [Neobacillus terrae]|uniref:anti sigma factor C-terminal domain-containing protein n=1 Tax=Neobacillus terrae TaxID=3034837 RepID=UPI00140B9A2B|nr:anti sigma factor C-terminal domain-containing protein [Neobacillus terrae]NHM33566.1 alkaline phosphatase [Neobacillus terrae]